MMKHKTYIPILIEEERLTNNLRAEPRPLLDQRDDAEIVMLTVCSGTRVQDPAETVSVSRSAGTRTAPRSCPPMQNLWHGISATCAGNPPLWRTNLQRVSRCTLQYVLGTNKADFVYSINLKTDHNPVQVLKSVIAPQSIFICPLSHLFLIYSQVFLQF